MQLSGPGLYPAVSSGPEWVWVRLLGLMWVWGMVGLGGFVCVRVEPEWDWVRLCGSGGYGGFPWPECAMSGVRGFAQV